ncbi:RWD domain-containing protein 2B [Trametes pubescens]|uniref:RWD domain-containing protein 2B n=1 Tax=Trametes pubescens TaxID=154538 RepID=A0A1M2VPT5_TRAPU|nr:RWD domain-containing protein 2B [Trametes pubescens]
MTSVRDILEELHLLKCSLLPGELLSFTEILAAWETLLDSYSLDPDAELRALHHAVQFEVRAEDSDVWFGIELPPGYKERGTMPIVSVKGHNLGRAEQERWQTVVAEAIEEVTGKASAPEAASQPRYHALFTSHHLKSPQKRRSLSQWSHELSLTGFAKVGYPGVIYCEGTREDIEDFVSRVKSMQWLALRLRFVEPVPQIANPSIREWSEFEKVGEVVEEMRRRGGESFVVEMGIGSAGASSAVSK